MDISNKLLLSLRQDLKVLNRISEEIIQKVSIFKLNSWLYPGKSYNEVYESHLRNNSRDEQYLSCLELMIDRLYLIINLFIKYIESFPRIPEEPKLKNVVRPTNLSLGASIDSLWKKLLDLNDLDIVSHQGTIKKISEEKSRYKSTQTNTDLLNICNSCATAISCMKEILNQLEMNINAMFVKEIKKNLHEDIYDITQNGCMNRIASAILMDIKFFLERLHTVEKQNKQSDVKVRELTIKYDGSLKIIRNLESLLKKIRKRSRNVKIKNYELTKKLREVVKINQDNEYTIMQERNKIKTLEKSIQELTASATLLGADNDKLLQNVKETLKEKINISKEIDVWKSRFSEIYLENRELKSKLNEYQAQIEPIKKSMVKIGNDCEKISAKLEQESCKILQKEKKIEKLLQSFMSNTNAKKLQDVDRVVIFDKNASKTFQITGDPITDMKKQVEVNMFNIKTLEQRNTVLLKTIYRVQEKILPGKFS